MARTKAEAAIERNQERERSRTGPTPALKANPQNPPQNFVGAAGSTDVAAMPPGAAASNPCHYPGCGGESHAGGPARHSRQVDYGGGSLAPASSKAEAVSMVTGPVDMEDAATEEASPITPPAIEHPLVELGRPQRSSTSTTVAVSEAAEEAAVSEAAEEAAVSEAAVSEAAVSEAAVSEAAEDFVATATPAEEAAMNAAENAAEDAAAVGVSAVSATEVDAIRDGRDLRDL